jgi:hypothetical protein
MMGYWIPRSRKKLLPVMKLIILHSEAGRVIASAVGRSRKQPSALMRVRVRSVLRVLGFAHAKRPIFPGDFHEINDDILRADAGRLGEQFGDALE